MLLTSSDIVKPFVYFDDLEQDCSNSIAYALELLQSCTKSLSWYQGISIHHDDTMIGHQGPCEWVLPNLIFFPGVIWKSLISPLIPIITTYESTMVSNQTNGPILTLHIPH